MKMTHDQQFILSVIRESILGNGTSEDLCGVDDPATVAETIKKNGILLTVFPAILSRKADNESTGKLCSILLPEYIKATVRANSQISAGKVILDALSGEGFDCIPLKGWELRRLYPDGVGRQMADLDILIRPYQFGQLKKAMERVGFTGKQEVNWMHDNFSKGTVLVEVHKRLEDDSGVKKDWEKRMWERAIPEQNHVYRMASEDFYVFHLSHMYKDFRNGALGLRRIIDTWLLKNRPIAEELVAAELEKMGLGAYRAKMEKLASVVMGEAIPDEDSLVLLQHAFRYGIYGSAKAYKAGRIVSMSRGSGLSQGKHNSFLAAVFLPLNRMKAQYPALEKRPILLPWYWARRIAHYTFQKNMKDKLKMLDYREVNEEDYNEMKRFFEAGE